MGVPDAPVATVFKRPRGGCGLDNLQRYSGCGGAYAQHTPPKGFDTRVAARVRDREYRLVKFFPLMLANLSKNKLRTGFTFGSIFFALVLFGTLSAVKNAFAGGADGSGTSRLRMIHKVSVVEALPVRHYQRVLATEGVARVAYVSWFGGVYQDPGNFFVQLAVSDAFLDLHPEYVVSAAHRERWRATRTGTIVGRTLAERFGWQVGDRIPITEALYQQHDGSTAWEFTIEGFFDGNDAGVDESQMFFHHEYLEESSPWADGEVRWFEIGTEPGADPPAIAARLDDLFATSDAPTKTSTEGAFLQGFANQVGDTALIITSVVGVTFFVLLLVVANAIAYSVRERLPELAVLKALGFTDLRIALIVIGECTLLCATAGGLGLCAALVAVQFGVPSLGMTSVFRITPDNVAQALLLVVALALVSGAAPALSAFKVRVADALGGR